MELIPRKIHAAWFGSRLPDDIRTRFARWRELNPGFELKLWTESNSPLHIPYLRNTLAKKYWSNASNFIRIFNQSTPPMRWLDRFWGIPASAVPRFANDLQPVSVRWLAVSARSH